MEEFLKNLVQLLRKVETYCGGIYYEAQKFSHLGWDKAGFM